MLVKDINRITKIKMGEEFELITWKMLSKEEKQNIIMRYIENIIVHKEDGKIKIDKINFRQSYLEEVSALAINQGYDINFPFYDHNNNDMIIGINFSTKEEINKEVYNLKIFYDVEYYESEIDDDGCFPFTAIETPKVVKLVFLTDNNHKPLLKDDKLICGVITTSQSIEIK